MLHTVTMLCCIIITSGMRSTEPCQVQQCSKLWHTHAVLHRHLPRHVIYYAVSSEAVVNTCRIMQEVLKSVTQSCRRMQEVLKSCDTLMQENARGASKLWHNRAGECKKCSKAVTHCCRRMQEVLKSCDKLMQENAVLHHHHSRHVIYSVISSAQKLW